MRLHNSFLHTQGAMVSTCLRKLVHEEGGKHVKLSYGYCMISFGVIWLWKRHHRSRISLVRSNESALICRKGGRFVVTTLSSSVMDEFTQMPRIPNTSRIKYASIEVFKQFVVFSLSQWMNLHRCWEVKSDVVTHMFSKVDMAPNQLLVLIRHLYLSGMWLGEAPKMKSKNTCVQGDYSIGSKHDLDNHPNWKDLQDHLTSTRICILIRAPKNCEESDYNLDLDVLTISYRTVCFTSKEKWAI